MDWRKKWIAGEIERWLREGIIDKGQAEKISALYPDEQQGRSWGPLVFQVIGAVIFGLGVILLFAYNWQEIPKFAKLALIFSALIAAHGFGYYFRQKGGGYVHLSEALHVLGTMFFGAGIWLVAQIYNIDEHYPNAFLIWAIGALVLGWSLPSIPQAIIASVLFCFWDGFEVFDFRWENHYAALAILFGVFPLAYKERSKLLLAAAVPAFILTIIFNSSRFNEQYIPSILIFVSATLIAISILSVRKGIFPECSPIYKFYGNIVYWPVLYLFTFHDSFRYVIHPFEIKNTMSTCYFIVFSCLAAVSWIALLVPLSRIREDLGKYYRLDHFGVLLALLVVMLNWGWLCGLDGWVGASLFNLVFLFQSVMLISHGCRTLNPKLTAAGTIMAAFLAFARYTDLFSSLLARGLVFLLVGAGIFAIGIFYFHNRKKMKPSEVKV